MWLGTFGVIPPPAQMTGTPVTYGFSQTMVQETVPAFVPEYEWLTYHHVLFRFANTGVYARGIFARD